VGYVPKNYPNADENQTGIIDFEYYPAPDYTVENIEDWTYYGDLKDYLSTTNYYAQALYRRDLGTSVSDRFGITLKLAYG
jgi:hypothetical protein